MLLPGFKCPTCGGDAATSDEPREGLRQIICAQCRTPMVMPCGWRCPACNNKYFHWHRAATGDGLYLFCSRCGRNYTGAESWRSSWTVVAACIVAIAIGVLDHHVLEKLLAEHSIWRHGLTATLYVACVGPFVFLCWRPMAWCPDFLADRKASPRNRTVPRDRKRAVRVKAIDEEYRFIQFNPFPCACARVATRKVLRHSVELRPLWLARQIGAGLLPVFRLRDCIMVQCPVCRGAHEYRFDIGEMDHIRSGFRRRFTGDGAHLIEDHMMMVRSYQQHTARQDLHGIEF